MPKFVIEGSGKWYHEMLCNLLNLLLQNPVVTDYLSFDSNDATIINTIWNMFEIVGIGVLLVCFLWELNKITLDMHGEISPQQVLAPFLKMCLGYAFVKWGKGLASNVLGFNNWVVQQTAINGSGGGITDINLNSGIKLLECIFLIVIVAIIALIGCLVNLVIIYQAISRRIELDLRLGFMPIAIGDVYKGLDSNAWRYLKKCFALALWGFAMVGILQIGSYLQLTYIVNIFNGIEMGDLSQIIKSIPALINLLVFPLAEAGMMSASKQICTDALGC